METENTSPPGRSPSVARPVPPGSKLLGELRSWFRDVVFALATAIFIVVFVIQPVKVEGTSMQPQLVDQERIFVNKYVYRIEKIEPEGIKLVELATSSVKRISFSGF